MANAALKKSFRSFSKVAAPFFNIRDDKSYEKALTLVEDLLEDVQDQDDDPLNGLISLLSQAITRYESGLPSLKEFDKQAHAGPADVAMLRLLMDQHQLGVAHFPEIGDKSLISRILSGERNLTKQHIILLSKRFNISPSRFF